MPGGVNDDACGREEAGTWQWEMLALERDVQAADADVARLTRELEDARRRAWRARRDLAQARRRADMGAGTDTLSEVPGALHRFHSAPVAGTRDDDEDEAPSVQSLIASRSLTLPESHSGHDNLRTCECCKCDVSEKGLGCTGEPRHFICSECADCRVNELMEEGQEERFEAQEARVKCDCGAWFELPDLVQALSRDTLRTWFEFYTYFKQRDTEVSIQQMREMVEEESDHKYDDFKHCLEDFLNEAAPGPPILRPPWWGDGLRAVLEKGPERTRVTNAFMETLPAAFVVHEVERIQNISLWNVYQAHKNTMLHDRQSASPNETVLTNVERTWLFHGTDEATVGEIVKGNFNRSFANKFTRYGKGCYFARDASYSADLDQDKREKYSPPNPEGFQFVILCRVLVGDYCRGFEKTTMPDYIADGTRRYDSTVDRKEDPSIFVTYHDPQVYPEYIVKFKDTRKLKPSAPPPPPPASPPPPALSPPAKNIQASGALGVALDEKIRKRTERTSK